MTLHILTFITRYGDDIAVTVSATVTRSHGEDGSGWVVEDLTVMSDDGKELPTEVEVADFTETFIGLADRA